MATAKMKIILPLVVWISWLNETTAQSFGGIGFGIKREVFFLNLEDGYFGCQVNESTDVLQLFELSKLCDGTPNCFLGSDELTKELKCTDDCRKEDGTECQNGACLDNQCYCNDGYGGCSCQVPDENECKYRPCDVFAHCTNTLGSFSCTCFPGYQGDGFHCEDINECDDPAIAARCVENAECCNLPAHFLCKCKAGYEGDGEAQCYDIDECTNPNVCGQNALCQNIPGNYTCLCPEGFYGNPFDGCIDVDECEQPNACGPGAICQNVVGGRECHCPPGYEGDAFTSGCRDMDECSRSNPCGRNSHCSNLDGSFRCTCPPGFIGDPMTECTDINECDSNPCAPTASCVNNNGSYSCLCPEGYTGSANGDCTDINECGRSGACGINAKCINVPGSFKCICPQGFTGQGHTYCENINECEANPCGENAVCKDTVGSYTCSCQEEYTGDPFKKCVDIDECVALEKPCGTHAVCENAVPGYNCLCPQGYQASPSPKVACELIDVNILCKSNFDCTNNAECVENQCFCQKGFTPKGAACVDVDECEKKPCGQFSLCTNIVGSFHCECENGYIGAPPMVQCKAPCDDVSCGNHAYCKPDGQEAYCICEDGWTFNPSDIAAGCIDIDECDKVNGPSGRCGDNAVCSNLPGTFACQCKPGFSGNPNAKCDDINECDKTESCAVGAICTNLPGTFTCQCPDGTVPEPDAKTRCNEIVTCESDVDCPGNAICDDKKRCLCQEPNIGNDCRHPCETTVCGPNEQCMLINQQSKCICRAGYTGATSGCTDIDECAGNPCSPGAICKNEPGSFSCQCPGGTTGDPYRLGCTKTSKATECSDSNPCPSGEQCIMDEYLNENVCICVQGYVRDHDTDKCRDNDECTELREKPACGTNAICKNLPGSYLCQCPPGFDGNPFLECLECNSPDCRCQPPHKLHDGNCVLANCEEDGTCPSGAECITITGGVSYCACPKGYRTLPDGSCIDINECAEQERVCGFGAECTNLPGSFECKCPQGYSGDPYIGMCSPAQKKCINDRECVTNEKCIQPGECVCPPPYFTDPQDGNKCKSPCERYPCGINTKCTPSDPPKCMCEVGYSGDPFQGCIDIDECAQEPCAYGAHCLNLKGGYKCVCPKGMTGDAYKSGCILETPGTSKSECQSNDDCASTLSCQEGTCVSPCATTLCGSHSICEPESHKGKCKCHVGYRKNSRGQCVSICEGIICASGAQCIATENGPTCKCLEGLMGNPFPGGQCATDICSKSNPCEEPNVCISGRCKQRCEGIICGVGAHCDSNTNKCVCDHLFVGNPNLLCMPPINSPVCDPVCGKNAHCQYGLNNRCICNTGTVGNPYELCERIERKICDENSCGRDAECNSNLNGIECTCPRGFTGNPYITCEDVDECNGNVCGNSAVCINTLGSYDCRCKEGYAGNPFIMCSQVQGGICREPENCQCSEKLLCPDGFSCEEGQCENECKNVECGPRATCHSGQCICSPGYEGNPFDLTTGCKIQSQCDSNNECRGTEICFQFNKSIRKCLDACSKVQCGPNALCLAEKHRSSCICAPGYNGDPSDLSDGCQLEGRVPQRICDSDKDCEFGTICSVDVKGLQQCISPCETVACGTNEICKLDVAGHPTCACEGEYLWNPVTSTCEKPSVPDCTSDIECQSIEACQPDPLGVLKCVKICSHFTCPENSACVAESHLGQCQCLAGFTGNPKDRSGCKAVIQDKCTSDAQCSEQETCRKHNKHDVLMCLPACEQVVCGPNAICVVNNHVPQCQCPLGSYVGDPNDPSSGCTAVPCVYNIDCPHTQLCNRLTHTCYDVCDEESCGTNAVCIAEDHKAICQCPPGTNPNPVAEVECVSINVCKPNPCHTTAICRPAANGHSCHCPQNTVGDPFTSGCTPEGNCPRGDIDCPPESKCKSGKCVNPCEQVSCGPNSVCSIVNRSAVCVCPAKYIPAEDGIQNGCIRLYATCTSDGDCGNEVCSNGQCRAVCRNNNDCSPGENCHQKMCVVSCTDHSQCSKDQACVGGTCVLGCRSNKNCPSEYACINNKCQDPCQRETSCGPNAVCSCKNHETICKCPEGFDGNPTPQQGCIRIPTLCHQNDECPSEYICQKNICSLPCQNNSLCAVGERCYNNICMKVCYSDSNCLQGEVCRKGVCQPGCVIDTDCRSTQICFQGKCKCALGFIGTPQGCVDIDECEEHPCHKTAICKNQPGSYTCICGEKKVGNPFDEPGCSLPDQCRHDNQCADELVCKRGKCKNPCEEPECGSNAICSVSNHQVSCSCPPGHLGNPHDTILGCFKVECIENKDCSETQFCDEHSNKCINPCNVVNCGKGSCSTENHYAVCTCFSGYALVDHKCVDIDECSDSFPCHATATCVNTDGSFTCICSDGLVGDPLGMGCRKPGDCFTDADCPSSAACDINKCRNPCESPNACGKNAECLPVSHTATCRCPARTKEDFNHNCIPIECADNNDCAEDKSCVDSKCQNPCDLHNICGKKATCTPSNHLGVCVCQPGTTGDPHLGCVAVQYCAADNQCPSSLKCYNGLCTSVCSNSRECISDQLCIQGICQPTCKSNSSCPDYQFCQNNICTQEVICRSNTDCDSQEKCLSNNIGRADCVDACEGVLCGRNAECSSKNHKATCLCKSGFKGNPNDDKLGCQKVECETNDQCSNDKLCDQYMCKIACLVHNPCGRNALCSAEHHIQTCYCQPGYTGDPNAGCRLIDFCADKPCGPGAVCHNSRGSFRCQCPHGSVGDPYNEGCNAPVECTTNKDCPIEAKCDKTNGIHKCRNVCENKRCGPNAECLAVEHEGHCTCRTGYQGSPNVPNLGCKPKLVNCKTTAECPSNTYCYGDICSPPCETDRDCQQDEQCVRGQCLNPCEIKTACGMNANCRILDHVKTCSCPSGFTGNQDVECVRLPMPCASDKDCNASICKSNMCHPQCQADNECAYNEKCLKGNCQLTCRVDNDCFLGHICLNNMCFYGCHNDDDCTSSESCRSNKCTNPCSEDSCGPNALCTVSNHRATCSCGKGFVANPSAKVACVRAPAQPCKGNRECPSGNICLEEFCRTVCSSDDGCLSNERCDSSGVCKPICRKDDDCKNDEICEGLVCSIGCRGNSRCPPDKSCVDNQCIDLCSTPTACGVNANCSVIGHQKQCRCEVPLTGNPLESCRYPVKSCTDKTECFKSQTCHAGICHGVCRTDRNCLSDERCIKGICKTICNSDESCGAHQICENRICKIGCRSDSICPSDQACINNLCENPCDKTTTCGTCANCAVKNHVAQCSCPVNFLGNPLVACTQAATRCNSKCECDEVGYCTKSCGSVSECSCGETCVGGKCRNKCASQSACAQGQICSRGACLPGCRTSNDCPISEICRNKKCENPCSSPDSCGKNAICKAADHRKVCLCPDGYQGDPTELCNPFECRLDEDCESNKKCGVDGVCRNPCLEQGVCGASAQCRVLDRKPLCSCPPGYIGNALIECKQGGTEGCSKNPCGANARCRDTQSGYECTCAPGCLGDAQQGCVCEDSSTNLCKNKLCGVGALCRVVNNKEAQCYCPSNKSSGDPTIECSSEKSLSDCRTEGCGKNSECIREQAFFVCRCLPGYSGVPEKGCDSAAECNTDLECPHEKACINFQCIDPCTLRGACGLNALCETVLHRPRCSCPECHVGLASTACHPDQNCLTTHGRPATTAFCKSDSDCADALACDSSSGECYDPCDNPSFKCKGNKKCEVHHHRPTCVCKRGFVVNELGEISCAPDHTECYESNQCPSKKACIEGLCQNPCTVTLKSPCPPEKGCDVVNHKPVCICLKNCSPSLSICLRDNGCPPNQACRAFRCEDPCEMANCPENTPCYVEDHKPICKFCPPGFKSDAKYGCVKDVMCHSHSECPSQQACINRKCQNPCTVSNPCTQSQDCQVQDHQPVCVKVCQCQRDEDCGNQNYRCDGCKCILEEPRIPQCQHCPPGIPCDPLTGACLKA